MLRQRTREVEPGEAALLDEDLADAAALLALDLERRLELRVRDESELDEDLPDAASTGGLGRRELVRAHVWLRSVHLTSIGTDSPELSQSSPACTTPFSYAYTTA